MKTCIVSVWFYSSSISYSYCSLDIIITIWTLLSAALKRSNEPQLYQFGKFLNQEICFLPILIFSLNHSCIIILSSLYFFFSDYMTKILYRFYFNVWYNFTFFFLYPLKKLCYLKSYQPKKFWVFFGNTTFRTYCTFFSNCLYKNVDHIALILISKKMFWLINILFIIMNVCLAVFTFFILIGIIYYSCPEIFIGFYCLYLCTIYFSQRLLRKPASFEAIS